MRLMELGFLYLLIGVGCGGALLVRSRERLADAVLLFLLWPLYGPFILMRPDIGTSSGSDSQFLDALHRADGTPLSALLPDETTARALAARLAAASRKVAEIDGLLRQPDFSEEAAQSRANELEKSGDTFAASMAGTRVQHIRRLRALRDRFARELLEVGELLAQLRVQAELVRLAGAPDSGSRDLITLLLARVEGLGSILDEEAVA